VAGSWTSQRHRRPVPAVVPATAGEAVGAQPPPSPRSSTLLLLPDAFSSGGITAAAGADVAVPAAAPAASFISHTPSAGSEAPLLAVTSAGSITASPLRRQVPDHTAPQQPQWASAKAGPWPAPLLVDGAGSGFGDTLIGYPQQQTSPTVRLYATMRSGPLGPPSCFTAGNANVTLEACDDAAPVQRAERVSVASSRELAAATAAGAAVHRVRGLARADATIRLRAAGMNALARSDATVAERLRRYAVGGCAVALSTSALSL
jgi:hypothetical protein